MRISIQNDWDEKFLFVTCAVKKIFFFKQYWYHISFKTIFNTLCQHYGKLEILGGKKKVFKFIMRASEY